MRKRRTTLTGSPAVPLTEVARYFDVHPGGDTAGPNGLDPARAQAARRFPVRWTAYYLDLADPTDPADPIRRIAFPEPSELVSGPGDLADPVGERYVNPVPFVVRKHRDRALLLVTARCHVYCRFCFRRTFPDGGHRDPPPAALDAAFDYLAGERELREVILSGGDPLVLPDETLGEIVDRLSAIEHVERLRVHTRAPVHDPARVTPALAATLARGKPMRVVLHFDHPREVTEAARRAVSILREAGLVLLDQTVLLAGVNDDPAVLEELFRALERERVKPYYLHHPDRAPGARAFYVELERGLAIHDELRRRLGGGPALPDYVIDPPDGSGKVPVEAWVRSASRRRAPRPT
jgi:lysine 2,3-aminomutase